MYLLDTNVVSELRRLDKADPGVVAWIDATSSSLHFLSVMTDYELEAGVLPLERRDRRQATLHREWLVTVRAEFGSRILPITPEIARLCATLNVPDRRPLPDAFIAATALHHGLTVVTRNVRDFDIPGLAVINPFA